MTWSVALEENAASILGRLLETACALFHGCSAASVTWVERGRPRTALFTNRSALDIDRVQYESGHGPCLRALREGRTVSADFRAPTWPQVSATALRAGVDQVLSIPMSAGGVTLGALNIYGPAQDGPTFEADEVVAALLAVQATVAMATAAALAVIAPPG